MDIWIGLAAALSGYLLGAISFARLIGRASAPQEDLSVTRIDIGGSERQIEFKGVSASSIAMRKGPGLGCLTSLLDMLKVFLPTLAFRLLYPEMNYFLIVGAAGMLGHNFPLYYRFKGGWGLSPLTGALLAIDPLAVPVTFALSALIGFFMVKDLFLAYGGATFLLIPWFWWRFDDPAYVVFALVTCTLFWSAAFPTLRQYLEFKRSGEFDKASLLETGHSANLVKSLRARGLLKTKDQKIEPPDRQGG